MDVALSPGGLGALTDLQRLPPQNLPRGLRCPKTQAARCGQETPSQRGDGSGVLCSLFCAHLDSMKTKSEARGEPSMADRAPGRARRPHSPALPSGRQETSSVHLQVTPVIRAVGKHLPRPPMLSTCSPGVTAAPQPASGRSRKTLVIFRKEHPPLSTRRRSWGASKGPGGAVRPPRLHLAGTSLLHGDRQSRRPSQGTRRRGRGRRSDRRSGVWISPCPAGLRGGGEAGRASQGCGGLRSPKARVGRSRVGHLTPRHSQPLRTQHQRVTARHSPQGRSHVGQCRQHGKGVTYFQGPFRNLSARPDV